MLSDLALAKTRASLKRERAVIEEEEAGVALFDGVLQSKVDALKQEMNDALGDKDSVTELKVTHKNISDTVYWVCFKSGTTVRGKYTTAEMKVQGHEDTPIYVDPFHSASEKKELKHRIKVIRETGRVIIPVLRNILFKKIGNLSKFYMEQECKKLAPGLLKCTKCHEGVSSPSSSSSGTAHCKCRMCSATWAFDEQGHRWEDEK